jgi:PAS domain-containing protein
MQEEAIKRTHRAGSSLHEVGSHFRLLLEKLPAGAYTCDPDGLITYFNQHAVRLWGRSPKLNDPEDRFCGSFQALRARRIAHRPRPLLLDGAGAPDERGAQRSRDRRRAP